MFDLDRRNVLKTMGVGGAAAATGCLGEGTEQSLNTGGNGTGLADQMEPDVDRVAADPRDVPDPIDRSSPTTHELTLRSEEVVAEIEPGVTFTYLTFGGQVPGPMLRVRQGDTIHLTHENPEENNFVHNVDFHACYGTGGAAGATTAKPGESASVTFRAEYPGAFIYHCAVPRLDFHISSGMYGMIVVEPEEGLPEVDHEFYFGQNEIYTNEDAGEKGHHGFSPEAMKDEEPTYVVLNGEKYAWTADRHGPLTVQRDETARVFLVTGGPNLTSNWHPIGNVWTEAWREGAVASESEKHVQTLGVPPGSCSITTMEFPVPERIKLVDHALTRVAKKGMMAHVDVEGSERPAIFDPDSEWADSGGGAGDGEGDASGDGGGY